MFRVVSSSLVELPVVYNAEEAADVPDDDTDDDPWVLAEAVEPAPLYTLLRAVPKDADDDN